MRRERNGRCKERWIGDAGNKAASELGKQEYIHEDIIRRKNRDMKLLEEKVKDRQKEKRGEGEKVID